MPSTLHFSLEKQRRLITNHGQSVFVLPVLQCPCITAERQFNPLCPACHGTGRYYPPGQAYTTMLLMHRESSSRTFEDPGTWIPGTIRATSLPEVRLAERDKVRMLDIRDEFSDEICVKGLDDTLRFSAGVSLTLVADLTTIYRPGVDYILTPPNTVTWVAGGTAPALGAQYSVKYEALVEYLVMGDTPRLRVEYHIPQSQEVILRRLDRISEDF